MRAAGTRRHKYGAVPTVVDGIRFASKAEAKRYQELLLLAKAGEIEMLTLQEEYPLTVNCGALTGGKVIGKYVADFAYFDKRHKRNVVEDVKGFKTPLYRWKKKHVEAQYGISITEVAR